jgi:hypothetical protein
MSAGAVPDFCRMPRMIFRAVDDVEEIRIFIAGADDAPPF